MINQFLERDFNCFYIYSLYFQLEKKIYHDEKKKLKMD